MYCSDRRLDAGLNLDGTMQFDFVGLELGEVARRGLDRPFLLFGAENHSHLEQPGSELNDPSWTSFWAKTRGWKLDINIPAGTHASFCDYQFVIPGADERFDLPDDQVERIMGKIDPDRGIAAQRAYIGAYFDQMLKHRPQTLLRRESPRYPEVIFVR